MRAFDMKLTPWNAIICHYQEMITTESMPAAHFDKSVVKLPEPGWIGEVLGTTFTSLEAQLLGQGKGLQSTAWRLQLSCDPPGGLCRRN